MSILALFLLFAQPNQQVETRIIFPQLGLGNAIAPEEASRICEETVQNSEKSNAMDLLRGAAGCRILKREVDASFLFNVGTIRGSVDFTSLMPSNAEETKRQNDLLVILYYQASGVGSDDVLRDPAQRKELVSRLQSWSPYFGKDYDPGWKIGEAENEDKYRKAIEEMREGKLSENSRVTKLVSDPEYWLLHQASIEILKRLGATKDQDPDDLQALNRIQDSKLKRAVELGDPTALQMTQAEPVDPTELADEVIGPEPSIPENAKVLTQSDSDVVVRCRRHAIRSALSTDGRILAEVITEEPEFGIVYRADVEIGPAALIGGVTRHYCSSNFTGSTPRDEYQPIP